MRLGSGRISRVWCERGDTSSIHGLRVRGIWLGNHISQHAGFNFRCQEQLWNNITLSASARSLAGIANDALQDNRLIKIDVTDKIERPFILIGRS